MQSNTTHHPIILELEKLEKNLATHKPTTLAPLDSGISFDPAGVYYDTAKAAYYVEVGNFYRHYTRKSPVKTGVKRFLKLKGENTDEAGAYLEQIEIDQAVDWSGELAGYPRGIAELHGRSFLVTQGFDIPEAKSGKCELHQSIINQAFPNDEARIIYCVWLRDAIRAIKASMHQPAPMMVMAGKRNAGKSLLAYIAKEAMGGRSANPITAWSGKMVWNDNLLKSELLLVDDSQASIDSRSRRAFGARFKEAIYTGDVTINTRNRSSIELRPVWRVIVCCNETPENLSVIPPLEDGIEDKIILLKVSKVELTMPTDTPEGRRSLQAQLKSELPAFLAWLDELELPAFLADSRDGVIAWKDPDLIEAINGLSPESSLETLLRYSLENGYMGIDKGDNQWMQAVEVQSILQSRDNPMHEQAKDLLKYTPNTGRYLASLHDRGSQIVTDTKLRDGSMRYLIHRQI